MKTELFINDIANFIVFLCRVIGRPRTKYFEEWMCQFVLTICDDRNLIDLGKLTSDSLHEKLTKFNDIKQFN